MLANKDSETRSKCIILGVYQISGGILGLVLTGILLSGFAVTNGLIFAMVAFAVCLYVYSCYCGWLLLKNKKGALDHSLVNQFLQLVNLSVGGYTFQYVSGVHLSMGFDLTESFNWLMNVGISNWRITIKDDPRTLVVNFNFVALFLIFFIDKMKVRIDAEMLEKQIISLGSIDRLAN